MILINSKIKRSGLQNIANFLMDHHTNPIDALERISYWVTKLEMQIDQGDESASIELSKHYSTDGTPQVLTLKKDFFEIEIEEIE